VLTAVSVSASPPPAGGQRHLVGSRQVQPERFRPLDHSGDVGVSVPQVVDDRTPLPTASNLTDWSFADRGST